VTAPHDWRLWQATGRQLDDAGPIDIHATGILSDLQAIGRALNPWWLRTNPWPRWIPRHPDIPTLIVKGILGDTRGWRRHALTHRGRRLLRNARRRNAWHGYRAEPHTMPPGVRRIGTGWTRARALRDLARAYTEATP
jgi:hypothetical protein